MTVTRQAPDGKRVGASGLSDALEYLGVLNPNRWFGNNGKADDRSGHRGTVDRILDLGIYVALIALFIFFSLTSPFFLTGRNLLNIGSAVAVIGVLAAGMTIALIAGQLDLTVGANVALTSVVIAGSIQDFGVPVPVAVLIGLAVGAAIGLLNSVLIVAVGINSIIATLAFGIVLRGLALILTAGQVIPLTKSTLQDSINAQPFVLPVSVWILVVVYLLAWVVMSSTRAGWHVYGVGGNASASSRAGIKVNRVYIGVFVTTGVLAALGGVITAGTSGGGGPNYANGAEFDVLTAVLLGGIGLNGGGGKIQRTLAGVFLIGILNNGLTLLSVDTYYQQLARGAVFVLAVVLSALSDRRHAR